MVYSSIIKHKCNKGKENSPIWSICTVIDALKKSDIRFAQEISIPARRARSEERSVQRYSSTERGEATQQGAKSTSERYVIQYPVTIAERIHLYPSRTQKLSSQTLMILGGRLPGKVGSCRFSKKRVQKGSLF